jgi:hypothetical protein
MSNEFRTTFSINKPTFSISYQSRIVSIGSCFAENISNRLLQNKFKVESNPFGITYNPFSIADGLQICFFKMSCGTALTTTAIFLMQIKKRF